MLRCKKKCLSYSTQPSVCVSRVTLAKTHQLPQEALRSPTSAVTSSAQRVSNYSSESSRDSARNRVINVAVHHESEISTVTPLRQAYLYVILDEIILLPHPVLFFLSCSVCRCSRVVVEYRTRNREVAGSTHTRSTASNLEQVANLCVQANSASYPQRDGK